MQDTAAGLYGGVQLICLSSQLCCGHMSELFYQQGWMTFTCHNIHFEVLPSLSPAWEERQKNTTFPHLMRDKYLHVKPEIIQLCRCLFL